MKKYLLLLSLAATMHTAQAQIQIGSNEIASMNRAGRISEDDLAALKKTTTLFTLPYKDYKQQQQFEEAIAAVWTITPFRIIKPDEMGQYIKQEGYSVFSFGGFMTTHGGSAPSSSNMHLAYDLWLPEVKKNGNVKQQYFARILIYPDNETFFTAMRNSGRKGSDFSSKMLSFLYNDAVIYNWSAGLLKGYLKKVNDHLAKRDERGPFTEEEDKQALSALKRDTLYVPDYVRVKFNMFTGAETADDDADDDLKKAYPFPVKIVTKEQLDALLLQKDKSVKYLVYVKSSTDKYINVYDSGSGKMLYARYVKLSYNFKNKDLGKLAKVVD